MINFRNALERNAKHEIMTLQTRCLRGQIYFNLLELDEHRLAGSFSVPIVGSELNSISYS